MIRLGLRLAVSGGREAVVRLAIITTGVALGVGMLLGTLAGMNAVDAQNMRYAWLETGGSSPLGEGAQATPEGNDGLWWTRRDDYFSGRPIVRIDVAATGPQSPVPPGIPRLPASGEFYASPAMSDLLASTPTPLLGERYAGREVGRIDPSAVPDPESLIVVVGHTPDALARVPYAELVTRIETSPPEDRATILHLVLSVVAAALLFPVLIFIGMATRLAATRREQRFAAIRLIGGTPRQVSVLSATESTAAAAVGTAAGFGAFLLLRERMAAIPFTGAPFYPDDLTLTLTQALLVTLGIPAAAAAAALIALRRVRVNPLGASLRVTPRAPRAYRLIPLLLGIGELTYFVGRRPATSEAQATAFLPGFLLIMAGLVIAGPWLTMVGARVLARRSSRPATLIAARRIADDPHAAFRAISGLVLALFVTSVAVGVMTTIISHRGVDRNGGTGNTALTHIFSTDDGAAPMSVPPAVTADLHSTPGVESVTVVRRNPDDIPDGADGAERPLPGVVACTDLARAATHGRCVGDAEVAQVWPDLTEAGTSRAVPASWPASSITADHLADLSVLSIVVGTDGTTAAIERARTILEDAFPEERMPPITSGEFELEFTRVLAAWQQLSNVVILASLLIAGCSLAVSIAGGLNDRKRPFALLRLSGVPVRVLRGVVALESAVPLLVVAAVAMGTGFVAALLFLDAQMDYSLQLPGMSYYLIVIAGLAAALGIIASSFPLLERMTAPENARSE